jgi:ribosomal protein L36
MKVQASHPKRHLLRLRHKKTAPRWSRFFWNCKVIQRTTSFDAQRPDAEVN